MCHECNYDMVYATVHSNTKLEKINFEIIKYVAFTGELLYWISILNILEKIDCVKKIYCK